MILKIKLTKDEKEWLDTVITSGGEITDFLYEHGDFLKGKKDWNKIQYNLYLKYYK